MKRSSENTVGLRILELRRKHRMSQGEFAKCIFLTAQVVSQWERGKRFPPCEAMVKKGDMSRDEAVEKQRELLRSG